MILSELQVDKDPWSSGYGVDLQLCSSVHFLMKEQPAAAHNGSHRPPFVSGVYRTACLRDPNPRFTERHPAFLRLPVHG